MDAGWARCAGGSAEYYRAVGHASQRLRARLNPWNTGPCCRAAVRAAQDILRHSRDIAALASENHGLVRDAVSTSQALTEAASRMQQPLRSSAVEAGHFLRSPAGQAVNFIAEHSILVCNML